METIFTKIKSSVSVPEAAKRYGLHSDCSGMCRCIFHTDQNPSMKLNEDYFYCFGCGKNGDVITLTAALFHLNNYEAAKKLANDFAVDISEFQRRDEKASSRDPPKPYRLDANALTAKLNEAMQKANAANLATWIRHAQDVLSQYYLLLRGWETEYAPSSVDDDGHPLFIEALQQNALVEYLLMQLDEHDEYANRIFYQMYNKEVKAIDKRIEQYHINETLASDGRAA